MAASALLRRPLVRFLGGSGGGGGEFKWKNFPGHCHLAGLLLACDPNAEIEENLGYSCAGSQLKIGASSPLAEPPSFSLSLVYFPAWQSFCRPSSQPRHRFLLAEEKKEDFQLEPRDIVPKSLLADSCAGFDLYSVGLPYLPSLVLNFRGLSETWKSLHALHDLW